MTGHAEHDDELVGPHGDDHGEDAEHDDHAHPAEALGPIDVVAWTYGVIGVGLGLVVALALAVAVGAFG